MAVLYQYNYSHFSFIGCKLRELCVCICACVCVYVCNLSCSLTSLPNDTIEVLIFGSAGQVEVADICVC